MNRRGFLRAILAAGAAPAVITSGVLMPVRALAIPTTEEVLAVTGAQHVGGNTILTIDQITREALRLAHENMSFIGTINQQYGAFCGREKKGDTIVLRRPRPYGG